MWTTVGADDDIIGTLNYDIEWTLVGSNFTSKPVAFNATFPVQGLVLEGLLTDACGGQSGSEISGTHGFYTAGDVPANKAAFWEPNGYNSYWGNGACKSQWNQFSFYIPQYPDTNIWLIVKSPVVYSLDGDPLYRFHTAQTNDLPDTPLSGD
ncbi:hypothetical protein QRX50_31545 [Amycolatopsis carbonis]|uniref:Uncharacterized protein n=1 Tax=Amycolatopsis carbonis TaxID=715471 RepID=A0A9Y2I8Y1_9PSEU|nr:hypothetical protein [Amycolatopsis sp. 2-15]WIX75995.1 hypothetical protein QRX50_31545 [Amycolatopsis sp. 2-15]